LPPSNQIDAKFGQGRKILKVPVTEKIFIVITTFTTSVFLSVSTAPVSILPVAGQSHAGEDQAGHGIGLRKVPE
jgi:hypothetical protein